MDSIETRQKEIIEEFALFDDRMAQYEYLIDLGKALPLIDPKYQTEEFRIRGCQSKAWLYAWLEDDKIYFSANTDAVIPRGLMALLIRIFSGQYPSAIIEADFSFLDKIALNEHLSPNRKNGLYAMIKKMKSYAVAFQSITAGSAANKPS